MFLGNSLATSQKGKVEEPAGHYCMCKPLCEVAARDMLTTQRRRLSRWIGGYGSPGVVLASDNATCPL